MHRPLRTRWHLVRSLAAALVATGLFVAAFAPPTGAAGAVQTSPPRPPAAALKPSHPRLDSQLSQIADLVEAARALGATLAEVPASVDVSVWFDGDPAALAARFIAVGGQVMNVASDIIEGRLPTTALAELGEQPGALRVSPLYPPRPAVTSEGATVHGSPAWNSRGFTGAGVKVGIIDVGFIGYSDLIGTELPAPAAVRCYTDIGTFTSTLSDCESGSVHGAGVAEAVVDIAPDVELYISNPQSTADLQNTAAWMASQGVQVINHSVGWTWSGSGDGTSIFSNAPVKTVDAAVADGIIWVNAAGNDALGNWYGAFSDPDGDSWHNFSGSDEANAISLTKGAYIVVQLRWDDAWGGASRDLDLFLMDAGGGVAAYSGNAQSGGAADVPREIMSFTAPASGTYYIAVQRYSGDAPSWLQAQTFIGPSLEHSTAARSIGNPGYSRNAGMLAVGAASWQTTDSIEWFSSQGPTTDGRTKPDITGADRGSSVTYGPTGFFGTSQASPHVAGLAALVLQRFPGFTPAQVADYLKSRALARGTVPNNAWGAGFAFLPAAFPPAAPTNVQATAGNGQATVTWSAPADDGGSPIAAYVVASDPGGRTATTTATNAVVTGLANGVAYSFTVVAVNSEGTSTPSAPSNAVVPLGPPGPPRSVTASAGDGQATVTWSAPADDGGAAITSYTVASNPGGFTATVGGSTLATAVTGLANGVSYTFTVTATNAVGTGPPSDPSNPVTPVGLPAAPTNVQATAGNGQATVSWEASSDDGGSPILFYLVTAAPGGATAAAAPPAVSLTIVGLTNGVSYTFTVRAITSVGAGPESAPSNSVVPVSLPGAPRDVTAVPGVGEVTVAWKPPLDAGVPALDRYNVLVNPGGASASTDAATLSVTVSGLSSAFAYTFSVSAVSDAGTGAPSASSTAVSPLSGVTFNQAAIALREVGATTTASIRADGLPPGVDRVRVNLQHSNAITIDEPRCAGIFAGATASMPLAVTGGTVVECSLAGAAGAVSSAAVPDVYGDVMTFRITRVAPGLPALTFGLAGASSTAFFGGGAETAPASTTALAIEEEPPLRGRVALQGIHDQGLRPSEVARRSEAVGVTVVSTPDSGTGEASVRPGADGTFEFDALPSRGFTLTVSAGGYLGATRSFVASAGPFDAPAVELRPGDANGDGLVDGADVALLAAQFGRAMSGPDESGNYLDLNGDGYVFGQDLALLNANFGASAPVAWP